MDFKNKIEKMYNVFNNKTQDIIKNFYISYNILIEMYKNNSSQFEKRIKLFFTLRYNIISKIET